MAKKIIYFLLLFFMASPGFSEELPPWPTFVSQLRVEALAEGIQPAVFDEAFKTVRAPSPSVLRLDKAQPEKRLRFLDYRDSRVDPYRILLGQREFKKHQEILTSISQHYGVNACYILSIWGLETSYGRYRGKFPVIQALATLAYNPRRSAYFRHELLIALHMLNDGKVSLKDFKGEWAGASGHCQFMPSTWQHYAVDYSGKGRADIWNNLDDAFASIANFLVQNGWHRDEPSALEVDLPSDFNPNLINPSLSKSVEEWEQLGALPQGNPEKQLKASIILPEGGPAFMIFDNFKTLLKWNHSNYYAASLGYLADKLCMRDA